MGEIGLQPAPPRKKQQAKNPVVAEAGWPQGRRMQIDSTRITLDDGVAWVYLVEGVYRIRTARGRPAQPIALVAATLLI